MNTPDEALADQSSGAAGSSHGLLGQTWALLRANWLVIGLFAALYHVPNWLVYGICDVARAPWCAGPQTVEDILGHSGSQATMTPDMFWWFASVFDLFASAVISMLFVMVLAALWTGRRSRVGRGKAREALASFSWTIMWRVLGVEVLFFAIEGLFYAAAVTMSASVFSADISNINSGGLLSVMSGYNLVVVVLFTLFVPLHLLWVIAIVTEDLPIWAALQHAWATIARSPGAVAAPLLILAFAQPPESGEWASAWYVVIWSTALTMVSSTLAVGLWLRARDDRVEPAELWRGGDGTDVAGDTLHTAAQKRAGRSRRARRSRGS